MPRKNGENIRDITQRKNSIFLNLSWRKFDLLYILEIVKELLNNIILLFFKILISILTPYQRYTIFGKIIEIRFIINDPRIRLPLQSGHNREQFSGKIISVEKIR